MRSLTVSGGDATEHVSGSQARFGTTVFYAGFHQRGTKNMPRRRIIGYSTAERRQTREVITDYLLEGKR
jgi:phage gpG-like protein